jgi:glycine cleavage system aminomethyltransferase T
MTTPSLQDGIDQAGSPVALLWKPDPEPWVPEMIPSEFAGWRAEQTAWHETVALSDLSHHMFDTVIEGPDATRLLEAVSANDYQNFEVGRAKQFIPVAPDGNILSDGILLREAEHRYNLSGLPVAQNWVRFHGENGGYDVTLTTDPSSAYRGGADPKIFRYQIQGPRSEELVRSVFGGPLPTTRFFHTSPVTLNGRSLRALRHGMAGQPGYEFIGDWQHAAAVKEALLAAGEPLGLVQVGAMAYPTSDPESGWIPSPTPAIYTDPNLADYRRWLPLYGLEGQRPLGGSYFSPNIEDYYCTPYELGYGRSISFNHDFIGRESLEKARDNVRRTKVTLAIEMGDPGYVHDYARNRVQVGDTFAGVTYQTNYLQPAGTVLALALLDSAYAAPGTTVEVIRGHHPGPGTDPNADLGFPRLRATVYPAPYDEYARTGYRSNA